MVLLSLTAECVTGQVANGELVPDLTFQTVLNANVKQSSLHKLKGKVVLIEFWATWCGSCLGAMPHLHELQRKYKDRLQVITVTEETAKRTGQYLLSKPSNLWFAIDTGASIAAVFPHQLIPHTVLISAEGRLIGNTSPEFVTDKLMDSVLDQQTVHLPEKKDNLLGVDELLAKNFYEKPDVANKFLMEPEIKGAPGFSTTYRSDSNFTGRRITAVNVGLVSLYSMAYGNYPFKRMIDSLSKKDKAASYCLDIIVDNKAQLLPTLQKELAQRFDVQAKLVNQPREVYVLTISDAVKFARLTQNITGKRTYAARHGAIDQQAISMSDFAEFLESYGVSRLPVINQTGDLGKYDIKFTFQPENPESLLKILDGMGLKLEKQTQNMDMLWLYKI